MKMLKTKEINEAIGLLLKNQIIILPTDTIYGLSALLSDANEMAINAVKQANLQKPLIILVNDLNQARTLVIGDEDDFQKLLNKEPTTVIFKSKNDGTKNLALRIVKRRDIREIINHIGPIFSTSVNLHGQQPLKLKSELMGFNKEIPVFYIGNLDGQPSKIYDSLKGKYIR